MSLFGNSVLAGSAGQGPSADLGDTIEQSLRFSGVSGQKLVGSSAIAVDDTYTLSFWYKHTHNTTRYRGSIFTNNAGAPYLSFNASNGTYSGIEVYNNSAYVLYPPSGVGSFRQLRDPSAWLHCVIAQVNSTSFTIYINGEQAFTSSLQCDWSNFALGGHPTSQYICDGYIADLHHVDGTALTPTSFGKYNEDGVWVPQDYTGSYGTNGFHLTFDSSQANGIGHDSSGNGNHFTASGFDTADIALYSANLVSSSGAFLSNKGPDKLFDGNTGTFAQVSGAGETMTFTPNNPISYQSLHYYTYGATWELNGTTTGGSTSLGGWQTIDSSPGTLTTLKFLNTTGGQAAVGAIAINGTATANILVDNTDNDVDYNDTPTSNYPTINPLYPSTDPPEQGNADEANLGYTGKANRFGTGATTMALPSSGEYYWEHEVVNHTDHQYFGVTKMPSTTYGSSTGFISFRAYYNINWYVYQDSTLLTTGSFQISSGDIIGQAYNVDTGVYRVWINGTLAATNTWTLRPTDEELFVFGSLEAKNSNKFRVNYGQRDFLFTPPTGAEKLQTNNLPEPTIKNGKDHFGTVTWTGNLTSRSITGLEFQPDFVWIKCRDTTFNHNLVDSVRGADKILYADLATGNAEVTSSNLVTSFNSDGFSVSNNASSNNTNNDYVAWCWKAGGTAVSNTNGTITSSVSANTDAGFSIVSYTGNNTNNATVGHGLDQTPEFIILKNRDASTLWTVYHKDIDTNPEQQFLYLNSTQTKQDLGNIFNDQPVGSSVFTLGNSTLSNANTNKHIAYCWHSVEGFSKFGSYTGNGSSNGPFVYCGFRPSLIICKSYSGVSGGWWMFDSTRSANNPADVSLTANENADEDTRFDIDILSNGFKHRTSDTGGYMNYSGTSYLFMAWAENPFGGENQPPATAR